MRSLSPIVRTSMKAGALVALALFCASTAEAARGPRRARERLTCDPATTTLRHLERVVLTDDQDDDEAIQNDAPAAHTEADERAMPVLTPIGLFIGALDTRLSTRDGSPTSPRGPPR